MSFEICNRCSVRNCRRSPSSDRMGRGTCTSHKDIRPKEKMLDLLWADQPRELMELLSKTGMSVTIGYKDKPRLERKAK